MTDHLANQVFEMTDVYPISDIDPSDDPLDLILEYGIWFDRHKQPHKISEMDITYLRNLRNFIIRMSMKDTLLGLQAISSLNGEMAIASIEDGMYHQDQQFIQVMHVLDDAIAKAKPF